MKVVINKCYGGLGLSKRAIEAFLKRKGVAFWTKEVFTGSPDYYTSPDMTEESFFSEYDIPRNDPDLVAVVEELGEASYGSCASLKVVEIPDDIEWGIEDYDGVEWIAEKHRTWR